jgi:hypothetical protein
MVRYPLSQVRWQYDWVSGMDSPTHAAAVSLKLNIVCVMETNVYASGVGGAFPN